MSESRDIAASAIMVSVAVAILSVAIPLTHNTISNISRRFNSDVMAKLLKDKVMTGKLVFCCVALIVSCLATHVFSVLGSRLMYKCFFAFSTVLFLFTITIFIIHIRVTLKYLTDPKKLTAERIEKVKKEIFRSSRP